MRMSTDPYSTWPHEASQQLTASWPSRTWFLQSLRFGPTWTSHRQTASLWYRWAHLALDPWFSHCPHPVCSRGWWMLLLDWSRFWSATRNCTHCYFCFTSMIFPTVYHPRFACLQMIALCTEPLTQSKINSNSNVTLIRWLTGLLAGAWASIHRNVLSLPSPVPFLHYINSTRSVE